MEKSASRRLRHDRSPTSARYRYPIYHDTLKLYRPAGGGGSVTSPPLLSSFRQTSEVSLQGDEFTRFRGISPAASLASNAASSSTASSRPEASIRAWASPESWERLKPRLTHMYVEQGRTLKEIMAIMSSEFDHHGTRRMYQKRFAAWGLSKNKHEEDMLFVLHKMKQREASGKRSAFIVRGNAVNKEDVTRYFSRKGGVPDLPPLSPPPTPEHIRYRSPSPRPSSSPATERFRALPNRSRTKRPPPRINLTSSLASACLDNSPSSDVELYTTQPLPDGYFLSCVPANDANRLFTFNPDISSHVMPSDTYRVPEELIFNITAYFDGSFESKKFIVDAKGDCINVFKPSSEGFGNLNKFYGSCVTGARFIQQGSFADARKLLSRACELTKPILEAESSRTLDCMIEMFLHLEKEGHYDVLRLLRRYMSSMATTLLATGRVVGPWGRLCDLIGMVETNQLKGAFLQAWKCTWLAFARNLGSLHLTTIRCFISYQQYRYVNDPAGAENLLQALLEECKSTPGHYRQALLLMGGLARLFTTQERYWEVANLAAEILAQVEAAGDYYGCYRDKLIGLDHSIRAQYHLRDFVSVEKNLLEAIDVITNACGETDPAAIDYWSQLEGYLRAWGRDTEAEAMKAKVNLLTGKVESELSVAELLQIE